ncbi:hypothetical protein N431DRAFT_517794 [Stipitochalara longipes BDJ]|nr:hypothetical protein N431DRAFT_517794 [Stipitochalara longipes BDJ]
MDMQCQLLTILVKMADMLLMISPPPTAHTPSELSDNNHSSVHQSPILLEQSDEQLTVDGSIPEQTIPPVTPTQNHPSRYAPSSVSGSSITTPSATSGEQSIAGDDPFVTQSSGFLHPSVMGQLSTTKEKTSLQQGFPSAAHQTTCLPGSISMLSNIASRANGANMYNPENVAKWLDVENASDDGTSTPHPNGSNIRSQDASVVGKGDVSVTKIVEQVIQELVSRGFVNALGANVVDPATATVDQVIQELINRRLVIAQDAAPITNTNSAAASQVFDTGFQRLSQFQTIPHDEVVRRTIKCLFDRGKHRDIRFRRGGIRGMLYAILWANTYNAVESESERRFWSLVDSNAKSWLPADATFLVHVTGCTLAPISKLMMTMPRDKRIAAINGGEFYFAVKKGGDFNILDHNAANDVKQDLIELGIEPVVQGWVEY